MSSSSKVAKHTPPSAHASRLESEKKKLSAENTQAPETKYRFDANKYPSGNDSDPPFFGTFHSTYCQESTDYA
jgi:hypothetical protein